MEGLLETLDTSKYVTIIPTTFEDFKDYNTLFDGYYRDMSGKVKKNHIFLCFDDVSPLTMKLRESYLEKHNVSCHKALKRTRLPMDAAAVRIHTKDNLAIVAGAGLNPYKSVELWKNYRPVVPPQFHDNVLYLPPSESILATVKDEKNYRAGCKKKLKATKEAEGRSRMKALIESVAFNEVAKNLNFDQDDNLRP